MKAIYLCIAMQALGLAITANAQDANSPQKQEVVAEKTVVEVVSASDLTDKQIETKPNVEIPIAQLSAQLRAMRKADLEKYLETWLAAVERQVRYTSYHTYQLESETLSDAEREEISAEEQKSHELELQLARRTKVIIEALEAKGGDVSEAQTYLKQATHISKETQSTSKAQYFFTLVSSWLKDPDGGVAFGKGLLNAILILVAAWILGRCTKSVVRKAFAKKESGSRILRDFILRSITTVVMMIGLLMALSTLGVQVGPMVAALGAGGFILGFALQDTLGNFASGMMIMFYQPFDEGDFVEISGVAGKVDRMSLVSTTMLTPDNKELIIPNKKVWGDTITNYSGRKVRRVDLLFGISYEDDIDRALSIIEEVAQAHAMVLKDPAIQTGVHSLGDSSVNLILRPWVKTDDYWATYWDLNKQVKQRFDKEGISIPFPQRDVHVIASNSESSSLS